MFTGIIYHKAKVLEISRSAATDTTRLVVSNVLGTGATGGDQGPKHGDSIAVNGCCLTVVVVTEQSLAFDAIPETLAKTNLGALAVGDEVHLERSLRFGDRVDGHIVQGHVDGTGEVVRVVTEGEWRVSVRVSNELSKYLVPKGSVAVDGVSLTLARVGGEEFDLTLIPTTLDLTNARRWVVGSRLNVECDATVKTIVSTLERMAEVGKIAGGGWPAKS